MKMKKLFLLIMALVISFTLVACGGDNDENNAAIQAKVDEADALVEEIIALYEDNGYAKEHQSELDILRSQIDEVKANNQGIIDEGGYDDETASEMGAVLDKGIAGYTQLLDTLKAALESAKG